MSIRIGIISLGCAKNLVNTEQMMHLLQKAGYEVTGDTEEVDAVIINTCAFIESAKAEAIETIIEQGRKKLDGSIKKLLVAGCLAQRYKNEILDEMPEVDGIIGVGSFDEIVFAVESALGGDKPIALYGDLDGQISETSRVISTSPVWAYLKIAEGCDNRCAYCVIPDIRGRYRSRTIENIVNEAKELAKRGYKELIIIAQDVTRYGLDVYGKYMLPSLLRELSAIETIKWIRLHYLYPDEITEELVDLIAENGKILKYLDIPIQHINDEILRNMRRRGNGNDIRSLFVRLRERIEGLVLRTSVITGLPGEGESEFEELVSFLREMRIERAGVFQYSPEEGTPAALMEKPESDIAAWRARLLVDIQSMIIDEFNESRIGSVAEVLVEEKQGDLYYGRSWAESPDVDGYIAVKGSGISINEFVVVRIIGTQDGVLLAERVGNEFGE